MAQQVVLNIPSAADLLLTAAYGSGALARLHRDTTAAFATATNVTTVALVTGTERYELWDADGASTSWYRFRIENSGGTELSDWSIPFQVLASREIATLASAKQRLGSGASATDDDMLQVFVDAANGAIIQRLGYYPGPASDTSRTYDGRDAVRGGKVLWIPGGVRAVTTMTIAGSTGAAATSVTTTDFVLRPRSYDLRPGEPYHFIEFNDVTTGNWSEFPDAIGNVNITAGLFGWGMVPADLVTVASAWAVRMWKSRNSGDVDIIGSDEFGQQIVSDRFPAQWRRTIDSYRWYGV